MSEAVILSSNPDLQLDPLIKSSLETTEDFESYYIQLLQEETSASWRQADLLLYYVEKFGKSDLLQFTIKIKKPPSTVDNYIRTARAFPPETRVPNLSFTHHMQASFIDEYDRGEFLGEKRFDIIEGASETMPSTRRLKAEVEEARRTSAHPNTELICKKCGLSDSTVKKYVLFAPNSGQRSLKIDLGDDCYDEIVRFITGA